MFITCLDVFLWISMNGNELDSSSNGYLKSNNGSILKTMNGKEL